MLKRILSILLCAALLCALCPGCAREQQEPKKLRVCFDTAISQDVTLFPGKSIQAENVQGFLNWLDDCAAVNGGITSEDIEVELIPGDDTQSTERQAALQRIRTEIMSGEGPDVFICSTNVLGFEDDEAAYSYRLFPYVEKAILDGRFLPLDDYLDRAAFADKDNLREEVMQGGRDPQGRQVVIPLKFSFCGDVYPKEELPEYDSAGKTWNDVLAGDDPVLAAQTVTAFDFAPPRGADETWMDKKTGARLSQFSRLADYETGKPAFTEEELFTWTRESLAAAQSWVRGGTDRVPDHASFYLCNSLWLPKDQEVTIVPVRNETGGATALVTLYCAVNANSKQADRAFGVIDALLHELFQKGGKLYQDTFDWDMPINKKINSPDLPIRKEYGGGFTWQQFEEYQRACDQINAVRFDSPLEGLWYTYVLRKAQGVMLDSFPHDEETYYYHPEVFEKGTISDEQLREIVHAYYEKFRRLLDEA